MKTRDITLSAVIVVFALTVFLIESQIPMPFAFPGFKLGLANIFTMITLYLWDKRFSFMILITRIILSSLLFSGFVNALYSLSGGIFCYFVLIITKCFFPERNIVLVSMCGAVAHNFGQLVAASFILRSFSVLSYFPILFILGILSGVFTGLVSYFCINNKYIKNIFRK